MDLATLKKHVETDLPDEALQNILDSESERVDDYLGANGSSTAHIRAGGIRSVFTPRPIGSITEIRERRHNEHDFTTLNTDDFRQIGRRELFRQNNGPNPETYWGEEVEVDYVPSTSEKRRDMAIVDLVKLEVEFRGLNSEKDGDWTGDYPEDIEQRRLQILRGASNHLPVA